MRTSPSIPTVRTTLQIRAWLRRFASRFTERDVILVLSLAVGFACGLASVLLNRLIWAVRQCAMALDGLCPSFLPFVLPGVGMLISLLIVRYLVKDDIGHGVTKVLLAVSKNESRIKPHNMWSSLLTSGITIGFGGSVGAEAPIVHTGAAIGSNLARWVGLSHRNVTILLGCGAAGAVAGIFKAPLAGILFTLEILLFNISMTSMLPLLLSTVSATVVSCLLTGITPMFVCDVTPFAMKNIPAYMALGVFCALCSLYFNKMTPRLEDISARFRNPYMRWAVCSVLLGVTIYLFPSLYGEGYDSLQVFLSGGIPDFSGSTPLSFFLGMPALVPLFFLLVVLLKVFSMTFTNAGGGVGGTFGPTLFIGGMAGFVVSRGLNLILAGSGYVIPEANFVLVGMAGLMAGVMQAPMTAIFLIAEISGGYELLLPLIMTSAISYGITHSIDPYSIYSKRIAKRGELLTHDSDRSVLTLLKVSDFIETDFHPVRIDETLGEFVKAVAGSNRNIFPVIDGKKRFQGYVALEDVRKDMFTRELYETMHVYNFMRSAQDYVREDDAMQDVMDKFARTGAWNLPVVKSDRSYVGFVSKSMIFSAYRERLRELSQD